MVNLEDRTPVKDEQLEKLPTQQVEEVRTIGAVVETEGRPQLGTMKIDLHCHSQASPDCVTPLIDIPARCAQRQVGVQAITDHNLIWGAQKLKDLVDEQAGDTTTRLKVIIGEEISSTEGEIIGLFLKQRVEAGLTPENTVEHIKAQGGLVLLPHGFDPLKRFRLRPEALVRIADSVDIVETFNARISNPRWNRAAVQWAESHGVLMSAGSDAHTLADIGSAWIEVPAQPISSPQDLLDALQGGVPVGEWTHPVIAFLLKMWDRLLRRLRA
jgi:predicted metal-dependent phosphoesterase TrpH